jgi:hypothetical protein
MQAASVIALPSVALTNVPGVEPAMFTLATAEPGKAAKV